ncbi:JAB domain-containing protein [Dinghuibacter silviterrae]|uniref:DNA repair protein RadC n=1 Tax=Dinghuibacter silviterrae TaxID=1539049 RepID=A0A4R8DHE5_9BACT|nr:JAB domain-containing protein [Dinghuibacter silviterrae]TDW97139.1 DNA repair protein RadC [Dinghuibacter silviterrae]
MNKNNGLLVPDIKVRFHPKVRMVDLHKIGDAKSAYALFKEKWNMDTIALREEFRVMYINQASRVLGIDLLAIGGINSAHLDTRIMWATALKKAATAIIVAHNHPSGNLEPSMNDRLSTRTIKEGGDILGIKLLDHLILAEDGFISFAEQGLL